MTNGIPAESRPVRRRIRVATVVVAVLLGIYWAALFYGTHMKLPPGILPKNSDKIVHFGAYAGLGVLLMSLRATRGAYPWFSIIGRWFVLAFYGAFDELTQLLVKRDAEIQDWIADVIGAALGLCIVTVVCWCFRTSTKPTDVESPVVNVSVP